MTISAGTKASCNSSKKGPSLTPGILYIHLFPKSYLGSDTSTKQVTTDPEAFRNPIQEGTGVITSDSLAADSANAGGSFGGGNARVSDQPSRGTTTNNTDTSGATVLHSAPNAEARREVEKLDKRAQPKAGYDSGKTEGVDMTSNMPDARSARKQSSGRTNDHGASGDAPNATPAPSAYCTAAVMQGIMKPKGRNIQEDEFDAEEAPNSSFNNDIGGENDPAREAENNFQRLAAHSGPEAGGGRGSKAITGNGQYDALREEQA